MQKQLAFEFANRPEEGSPQKVNQPTGYSGLYRFHKYWGKKPYEPLAFAIEQLTQEGDTILDPFVGSGIAAREAMLRNRRFIGFDVNPIAIELTKLLVSPPEYSVVRNAFLFLEKELKQQIYQTYKLKDGRIASHYLWENDILRQVWLRGSRGNARVELSPTSEDLKLIEEFEQYKSRYIRSPRFFSNGRINASPQLSISDLMTGRAQHNIDLIINKINELPLEIQKVMKLCLTAASGQMTKMVFAVTGRGKTNGRISERVEVGSWVIGYLLPQLHFEVNVWNYTEHRVSKLLKAIKEGDSLQECNICDSIEKFYTGDSKCCLVYSSCQNEIGKIDNKSVSLILTDPPHSDRIPYLELSELWNSILGVEPSFESEIVISNAKERLKTPEVYNDNMSSFFAEASKVMKDDAFLVLFYNARQQERWKFIKQLIHSSGASQNLEYFGLFPCKYSARSVVQDNREGGLKHDVALVFGGHLAERDKISLLQRIPGWSTDNPQ